MEMNSSPDACNKTQMKMETDGWYIDFEPQFDCGDSAAYSNYKNYKSSGCQDKSVMKTVGTVKRGYPVYEKMTMFDESGKETMSYINEVVELSKATLEMQLFDVPAGYTEASDASQMYASMSAASMSSAMSGNDSSPSSSNSSSVLSNASNAAVSAASAVGPKKAGTIRIGLAGVKTGAVGDGLSAADLSAAVQNTLVNYLKVPNVEVVTLDAKLPSAIDSEAKQKECDYVVHATASHKKGGGGFGSMFGSALGSAVGSVGIGHTGSTAGNIAGQVATRTIVSATTVSANIKAKDEITLDLKLNKIDGINALAKVYKAKAKSSGDDIISSVVEQAAQAVVTTIGR